MIRLESAACRGKPQEWWFPGEHDHHLYAAGREVCRGCSELAACLELGWDEPAGMWGGKTPSERKRLRAGLPPPRYGPPPGRRPAGPQHGSAQRIAMGCRCASCRAAAAHQARQREAG